MRKGLVTIKCSVPPATFPGMPVRVWNGVCYEERVIAEPTFGWWRQPDAWVHGAPNVREGIEWANNRWNLLASHDVTTVKIKTAPCGSTQPEQ